MAKRTDSFGARLHRHRVELGHTQGDAARQIGVSRHAVMSWEGGVHLPLELTWPKIGEYMGLTFTEVKSLIEEEASHAS